MLRNLSNPSKPDAARRSSVRLRTALATTLILVTMGLAGCGDPDDDDGGGGGYVAAPLTEEQP